MVLGRLYSHDFCENLRIMMSSEETEYHSKDFEWEELRQQIENDHTLRYHFLPYTHQSLLSSSSSSSSSLDSQSWNQFHARHSTGKFFKVHLLFLYVVHNCSIHSRNRATSHFDFEKPTFLIT